MLSPHRGRRVYNQIGRLDEPNGWVVNGHQHLSLQFLPESWNVSYSGSFFTHHFCPIHKFDIFQPIRLPTIRLPYCRDNPYLVVISIDFSKAFDTIRQSTLLEKLAQLDIQDQMVG